MKKVEIEESFGGDTKRFYMPIAIKAKCPKCKSDMIRDFKDQYLSYPIFNKDIEEYFYCDECDSEFSFDMQVNISLSLSVDKLKEL